jgi:hypothetical protein
MPPISAKAIGRCNWFPKPDPDSIGRVGNNYVIATMIMGFNLLDLPEYIATSFYFK